MKPIQMESKYICFFNSNCAIEMIFEKPFGTAYLGCTSKVKIWDGDTSTIIPMHKDYIFQLKSPFQIFSCKWSSYMCCCYEM